MKTRNMKKSIVTSTFASANLVFKKLCLTEHDSPKLTAVLLLTKGTIGMELLVKESLIEIGDYSQC